MNFQSNPVFEPLRVLVTNPLNDASQLAITKMMSGLVFGPEQLIDLILLVYANEKQDAEDLKWELHSCSFICMNTIVISTDLPLIEDADVFCFITNFPNPNSVNFNEIGFEEFDVLYSIIKIAHSLAKTKPVVVVEEEKVPKKKLMEEDKAKPRKPIIMADGIITMNILRYITRDSLPNEIFFCPTPLATIAKAILGEQLKVSVRMINTVLVWGANDEVFHAEVAKPIISEEKVYTETYCDWDMISRDAVYAAGLDFSQFNRSWLRKEFIQKIKAIVSKNPYGNLYRAADFARTLAMVWKTRASDAPKDLKAYTSAGVISDGSLDTIKGMAYVLPLVFTEDTWSVDRSYENSLHLQQELIRINKAAQNIKDKLYPYCKKFLEDNVKNQMFIPASDTSVITAALTK